jgi:hypothetical protein
LALRAGTSDLLILETVGGQTIYSTQSDGAGSTSNQVNVEMEADECKDRFVFLSYL